MSLLHLNVEDAQFKLDNGFASLADAYQFAEIYNRTKTDTRCDVKVERRRPRKGWPVLAIPTLVITEIADF